MNREEVEAAVEAFLSWLEGEDPDAREAIRHEHVDEFLDEMFPL